jgi:hypothetical protein
MSLPRSHSPNGPTNPRNKSQTNPTRKHNSKSKGLSLSGKHQADCPQVGGGPSEIATQTSSSAPKKRTVRDGPANRPPRHGPSDTLVRNIRKLHAPKTQ